MIKILVLAIIVAFSQSQAVKLPVGFIPGLGDSCLNPISMLPVLHEIQMAIPNKVFCIDAAPIVESYITSFASQVERACKIVNAKNAQYGLDKGFILVGFSQGGLTARALLETCNLGASVKKLITYGGPHQGVSRIPNTDNSGASNWINNLTDKIIYNSWVQKIVGPAGYYHRVDDESTYFNSNIVLKDINNAGAVKNPQYKARILQLEAFVMVMWTADTMIIPKESEHFGFWSDASRTKITALEDSKLYTEDWIGMKQLNAEKKVFYHSLPGGHMAMGMPDWRRTMFPYL